MQNQPMPPLVVSLVFHGIVLGGLFFVTYTVPETLKPMMIETVVADEDRQQEEFQQELDTQEEVAETMNFIPGSVSTEVGGSNAAMSQQHKVEHEDVVRDPEIKIKVGSFDLPAGKELGTDLGESEVTGDVGAVVEGYGAALDRLTQELIRMMRSNEVMVVWLFDESGSMKDDQEEIKKRIGRVYEELKIVDKDPAIASRKGKKGTSGNDILLTAITSFGEKYHVHTPRPTSNVEEIVAAIDRIPVDESGKENTCAAMLNAIGQYRGAATRGGRKLAFVLVSDESGDDGLGVEDVLSAAKSVRAPIYVLGREAVFGSLYAHVRWRQPETGRLYYLPIRRGPETPFAEQLQYDGYRRRRDSHLSGFGPYEQVRWARDTGGIFFQLPHEEQNINDLDDRKFAMLDLREYVPDISSRREYLMHRQSSEFRKAIWDVIAMLNPYNEQVKDQLELPEYEYFHVNPAESVPKVAKRLQQIVRILGALSAAQQRLASVQRLRDQEPSPRWRANYDLMVAQLYAYRVRIFQYGIALDQFSKTMPQRIKKPKSNRWSIRTGTSNLIMPDPAQEKLLKVTAEDIKSAIEQARKQFAMVQELHPRTPWARRAEWEEKRGYGANFSEHYHAPPKRTPRKPRPKPTPPPKL